MTELTKYIVLFGKDLTQQLERDQKRWGDTWKDRGLEGQEERIFERFQAYMDQYRNAGTPVPWLKIAALCLIARYREHVALEEVND